MLFLSHVFGVTRDAPFLKAPPLVLQTETTPAHSEADQSNDCMPVWAMRISRWYSVGVISMKK